MEDGRKGELRGFDINDFESLDLKMEGKMDCLCLWCLWMENLKIERK